MWLGRTRKLRQEEIWAARLLNRLTGHRFKPLDGWRPPLWRLREVWTLPVPVQNLYRSHLDLQPIYLCLYTSCIPFTLQACHNPLTLLNMPRFQRYPTKTKFCFTSSCFSHLSFLLVLRFFWSCGCQVSGKQSVTVRWQRGTHQDVMMKEMTKHN